MNATWIVTVFEIIDRCKLQLSSRQFYSLKFGMVSCL
jgi:hypothetical protein